MVNTRKTSAAVSSSSTADNNDDNDASDGNGQSDDAGAARKTNSRKRTGKQKPAKRDVRPRTNHTVELDSSSDDDDNDVSDGSSNSSVADRNDGDSSSSSDDEQSDDAGAARKRNSRKRTQKQKPAKRDVRPRTKNTRELDSSSDDDDDDDESYASDETSSSDDADVERNPHLRLRYLTYLKRNSRGNDTCESVRGWDVARQCRIHDNRCGCTSCAVDDSATNNSARYIQASDCLIVKRESKHHVVERLVIFTSSDKTKCYEYTWHSGKKLYLCSFCMSKKYFNVNARRKIDPIDGDYYKLGRRLHICIPIKFVPEDPAIETKLLSQPTIYQLPNYRIVYRRNKLNQIVKKLAVFENLDEGLCYEFTWNKRYRKFVCDNCYYKDKTKNEANMFIDDDGEDAVEITGKKHTCSLQTFVPGLTEDERDDATNNGDLEFQIVKRKSQKDSIVKHLVIFLDPDHSKCFEYSWNKSKKKFFCSTCLNKKRIDVFVKLQKKHDVEYLEYGHFDHQCEPIEFLSEDSDIN